MIEITAVGFIAAKPELQLVGASRKRKVEFDVVWGRREFSRGEWNTMWERATFFAWEDEAEKLAERLDKGSDVKCIGIQETYSWTPQGESRARRIVKYRLVWWEKVFKSSGQDRQEGHGRTDHPPAARSDRDDRPCEGPVTSDPVRNEEPEPFRTGNDELPPPQSERTYIQM